MSGIFFLLKNKKTSKVVHHVHILKHAHAHALIPVRILFENDDFLKIYCVYNILRLLHYKDVTFLLPVLRP